MFDLHQALALRFLHMLAQRQQYVPQDNPGMNYDNQPWNPQGLPQAGHQPFMPPNHDRATGLTGQGGGQSLHFNPHARLDLSQIDDRRAPGDPSRHNVELNNPATMWRERRNGKEVILAKNNDSARMLPKPKLRSYNQKPSATPNPLKRKRR